jgi:site-specific recombinase XerD
MGGALPAAASCIARKSALSATRLDAEEIPTPPVAACRHDYGQQGHRAGHATLCSFFRWLVQRELIDINPMLRVAPVETVSRLPRPLAADAVRAVLQRIPSSATRDRALFTLLYETGMRRDGRGCSPSLS